MMLMMIRLLRLLECFLSATDDDNVDSEMTMMIMITIIMITIIMMMMMRTIMLLMMMIMMMMMMIRMMMMMILMMMIMMMMMMLHNVPPYSASATYSPNAQYVLTSCFNSEHRLIPLHKKSFHSDSGGVVVGGGGGAVVDNKLHVYRGHVNQRFSVQSRIYSSAAFGSFILSGSEDGKVLVPPSCRWPNDDAIALQ